jgi:hypothetical protein
MRNGVTKGIASLGPFEEIDYIRKVLTFAAAPMQEPGSVIIPRLVMLFQKEVWAAWAGIKNSDLRDKTYDAFRTALLESYESHAGSTADDKGMILILRDLLVEKERADRSLESIISLKLLTPDQVVEMKSYQRKQIVYYDNLTRLVCLYYVDLPLRLRILWVSLSIDKAKGYNDDEDAIMKAGQSLAQVCPHLNLFVDPQTHDLYMNVWKRLKNELRDKQFSELDTRAKLWPDWMKTITTDDINKATN